MLDLFDIHQLRRVINEKAYLKKKKVVKEGVEIREGVD